MKTIQYSSYELRSGFLIKLTLYKYRLWIRLMLFNWLEFYCWKMLIPKITNKSIDWEIPFIGIRLSSIDWSW